MPSSQTPITLSQPIMLPCGAVLSNRIAKAAMSEGLSDSRNHATPRLERLYARRSEEHTSELQSLMRISYAVFCLKKKNKPYNIIRITYMQQINPTEITIASDQLSPTQSNEATQMTQHSSKQRTI